VNSGPVEKASSAVDPSQGQVVPSQGRGRGRGRTTEAEPADNPNATRRKTTRGVNGKETQETHTEDGAQSAPMTTVSTVPAAIRKAGTQKRKVADAPLPRPKEIRLLPVHCIFFFFVYCN